VVSLGALRLSAMPPLAHSCYFSRRAERLLSDKRTPFRAADHVR
jgi:hypothetical protein